ncbi:response regulator transcription factor [Rufibacter roseus]|uniref:Response regulator transcription factor n=1 Tax=Rufibacter roseus TaxID=1567108 RepID=A0ABW2DJV3_9BACT|nr:helix-turn-helix transcriptional regulator [Rufibacter roseus]
MNNPRHPELQRQIDEKIAAIAAVADQLPGVVIIHDIQRNFSVEYMSPNGLASLGVTLEQLKEVGADFYLEFFHPSDDSQSNPSKLAAGLFERNDPQEIISFFEQVKFRGVDGWHWHLTTMKILLQDEEGLPLLTISIAILVDPKHHITPKVARLLEENTFLRNNYQRFATLGGREQEILRLVALGKSSVEIGQELNISEKTVNTHRRNIKSKLEAHTNFELSQYALAFDLI